MSVPDREQLVSDIGADMASNWWRTAEGRAHIAVVLGRLDELGYSVTPAESPAEAAVRPQERPEGSEAAHTAERAVIDALPPITWDVSIWRSDGNWLSGRLDSADVKRIVASVLRAAVESEETPT